MFSLMANSALQSLKAALNRQPTAAELYLAQLITPAAAATAIANPTSQISVPHPGLANPVQTKDALTKIAADLQAALDTVKAPVAAAGTELLGDDATDNQEVDHANQSLPGGISTPTGGTNTTGISGAGGPLGTMVARFESRGSYNAFNRGIAGVSPGPPIDFAQLTLAQVMAQQTRTAANPRPLFAVGKYQLIPSTMKEAIRILRLDPNTKMTHEIQENFFRNYLIAAKRPRIKSFITGGGATLAQAQFALALEFASMPDPTKGGRSHYGGIAGNKALVDLQTVASKLNEERALFQQKVAGGMSAADAWNALST
jgi:hypothetical protein